VLGVWLASNAPCEPFTRRAGTPASLALSMGRSDRKQGCMRHGLGCRRAAPHERNRRAIMGEKGWPPGFLPVSVQLLSVVHPDDGDVTRCHGEVMARKCCGTTRRPERARPKCQ